MAALRFAATCRVRLPVGLSRGIACLTTVFLLASAVRAGGAISATPPPMVRVAPSDPPQMIGEPARSAFVTVGPGQSTTYTVEPGDCLWRIARTVLTRTGRVADGPTIAALWRSIYERNAEVIGSDPDLIHPGQVLSIPEV